MPTRKWPRKDAGLLGASHTMTSQDTEDSFFELSEEEAFAILSSGATVPGLSSLLHPANTKATITAEAR